MDVATWLLYRRESTFDLPREKRPRPYGKDTALVRRITEAAGSDARSSEATRLCLPVVVRVLLRPAAPHQCRTAVISRGASEVAMCSSWRFELLTSVTWKTSAAHAEAGSSPSSPGRGSRPGSAASAAGVANR